MAALLSFAAWIFNLFLGFVSAALAGWFFLFSPTFRHQAYARWARQPQLRTIGEIGEGAFGVAGTLALVAALIGVTVIALARTIS
jgi:hypothetical protein